MPVAMTERHATRVGLVALLIIKLFVIVLYGPLTQPDTGGYVTYATQMVRDTNWLLYQPGGGGDASYRMVGYPALIVLAKAATGPAWDYSLVVVQAGLGLVSVAVLYRFFRRVLPHWRWALAGAAGFGLSQAVVFDVMVLTDGIYGSIIAIAAGSLGVSAVERSCSGPRILFAGVLLCFAFLIRESTLVLGLAFLPLVAVAAYRSTGRLFASGAAMAIFMAPILITAAAYVVWNQYRSEAPFVTTGARTAYLLPLVRIAEGGLPIFDGSGAFDETVRATLRDFTYEDVLNINRELGRKGWTAIEISQAVSEKYRQTVFRFPGALASYAARELRLERRTLSLAHPVRSFVHLEEFKHSGSLGGLSKRIRQAIDTGDLGLSMVVALELAFNAVAIVLGVLAFIVFPIRYLGALVLRAPMPDVWHVVAAAWLLYAGFISAYAMIRVEDRYLIGVAPMMLLAALVMAADVVDKLRNRWLRSHDRH